MNFGLSKAKYVLGSSDLKNILNFIKHYKDMAQQNFVTLPVELWEHISQLVAKSQQTRFRQASPTFRNLRPTMDLCCSAPTNFELATYLMAPKYINFVAVPQIILRFSYGVRLVINKDGTVRGTDNLNAPVILPTRDSIIDYIQGYDLDPNYLFTWIVYRHLFHQREVCKTAGIDPDECYIRFITENLPNIRVPLFALNHIIKSEAHNKLSIDFKKAFPESSIFAISSNQNKRYKQIEWLRHQLQKLKPTDLRSI